MPSPGEIDGLARAAPAQPERLIDLLAARLVPAHADWCMLHIERVDNGDDLPLPAPVTHVRHRRPELDGALRKLVAGILRPPDGSHPADRVLREGKPCVVEDPDIDSPVAPTDAEQRRLRALVGFGTVLLLPLSARGRAFGVLALGRGGESAAGRPRFDEDDTLLAAAFAGQAALALDHASLHRAARLAREGLRDIQSGRDARISRLAHALRGPLAPLRQGIELLRSTPDDSAGVLGTARVLARQVDRLAEMVDQLAGAPRATGAANGDGEDGRDGGFPRPPGAPGGDPAAGASPVAMAARPATDAGASRPRVLIVDDNDDAASTLAMLLRRHGFDPHVAHGGQQALDAAAASPFAIALLDIGLPGMNGYELAGHLRRLDGGDGMLLIAMTGYDDGAARARSREAGFAHHFVKPVDLKRLLAALRSG